MKNPYEILNVNQDVDNGEIMKAQIIAMKEKNFSLQEIQIAVRQLLNPAKRLAADFMFPTKIRARRIQKIPVEISLDKLDLCDIDKDALDSLK